MNNIIDASYFEEGIKFIPNVKVNGTPVSGVPTNETISKLEYFIDECERLLLFGFLTVDQYDALQLALVDIDIADLKWQNLVKGTDYVKDGVTYRFNGLMGVNKNSLIAHYTFCEYLSNDESYYATSGVVRTKDANAVMFDPTKKYIDNYNAFLSMYQDKSVYDEPVYYMSYYGVGVDWYESKDNSIVTLETFLRDNEADYEGYNFNRYERLNSFGI